MAKKILTINKSFLIFLLLVSPITLMALFSYVRLTREMSDLILSRRETVAQLSAQYLEDRFNNLINIGTIYATRDDVRNLVRVGKWQEAMNVVANAPKNLPFIERIFFSNPQGVLEADAPMLPDVRGKDFSFRDWYVGVSRNWEPYVSGIYKRTAEPRLNVVAVAIPIKSDAGQVLGIFVLQIRVDTFLEWSKLLSIGDGGFIYFVDQYGNVAAHPDINPQGDIVDFSDVPEVAKALKGEHGVEVLMSPFESEENFLVAFYPVNKYDWGVIVSQPEQIAFMSRDDTLMGLFVVFLILFVLDCLLAYVLTKVTNIIKV